jgi:hypothetical protein
MRSESSRRKFLASAITAIAGKHHSLACPVASVKGTLSMLR